MKIPGITNKIILIVSDFHLGKGPFNDDGSMNLLEEFYYDNKFASFLEYYDKKYPLSDVELVFNGDIFDLIQVEYHERFPSRITERTALEKFNKIINGHPLFFSALKNFLNKSNRSLTYIQGNHDVGFLFPIVRDRFEEVIGKQYHYAGLRYKFDDIWIEHGQQYEPSNAFNEKEKFITKGVPEPIVNLPWGSLYVVNIFNKLKKKRPYLARVRPFSLYLRWALINDFLWAIMALFKSIIFFISNRFIPSRWYKNSFTDTLKIIKDFSFANSLETAAKKILKTTDYNTVILSHSHKIAFMKYKNSKTYLNTGCWMENINLDLEHFGKSLQFSFVKIEYSDSKNKNITLKQWNDKWDPVENIRFA